MDASKESVVFAAEGGGCSLLLTGIRRGSDGAVKSGWVVNGGWDFEVRDGECLAKSEDRIVSRWPAPGDLCEIAIDPGVRGDYNRKIQWAEDRRRERAETGSSADEVRGRRPRSP